MKHVTNGCSNPECTYSTCRKARLRTIEALMCATLNLADIPMTPEQRHIADEIYQLASKLEDTYQVPA